MDGIQLIEWLENPVTKKIFKDLETELDELKATVVAGAFSSQTCEALAMDFKYITGQIAGIERLLRLKGNTNGAHTG